MWLNLAYSFPHGPYPTQISKKVKNSKLLSQFRVLFFCFFWIWNFYFRLVYLEFWVKKKCARSSTADASVKEIVEKSFRILVSHEIESRRQQKWFLGFFFYFFYFYFLLGIDEKKKCNTKLQQRDFFFIFFIIF